MITGATSYVGARLTRLLLDANVGWTVHVIARPTSDLGKLGRGRDRVTVHEWDGSAGSIRAAVSAAQPTDVFHLAAAGGARHEAADVDALIDANLRLGTLLLEALGGHRPVRFVMAGSYWQHASDGRVEPVSLHAALKEALLSVMQWHHLERRVHSTTLIIHDVYGPNDPRPKLLSLLLRAMSTGEALDLSPGDQRLDFVHVDDVAAAFLHAADLLASGAEGVEGARLAVRTGQLHSLRELVAVLESVSGRPVPVRWGARPHARRQLMVPWEGPILPGWSARTSLRDGLAQLVADAAESPRP